MPTVQKFVPSMMEEYLKGKDLKYMVDHDGDYRVEFAHDSECDCELTVWLIAGGPQKDVYCVRVNTDKHIPQRDWGKAVLVCNQWNKERRWPKAFLYYKDSDSEMGDILLEGQIDLEQGVHRELFNDFTDTVIATSFQFWKWAHEEKGL
jgi:hypothetical protein